MLVGFLRWCAAPLWGAGIPRVAGRPPGCSAAGGVAVVGGRHGVVVSSVVVVVRRPLLFLFPVLVGVRAVVGRGAPVAVGVVLSVVVVAPATLLLPLPLVPLVVVVGAALVVWEGWAVPCVLFVPHVGVGGGAVCGVWHVFTGLTGDGWLWLDLCVAGGWAPAVQGKGIVMIGTTSRRVMAGCMRARAVRGAALDMLQAERDYGLLGMTRVEWLMNEVSCVELGRALLGRRGGAGLSALERWRLAVEWAGLDARMAVLREELGSARVAAAGR